MPRVALASIISGSSLLGQASIYAASNLIGRAIPFLLLPVLTRYLSPADYGIVTMFMLTVLLLEPLIGLGLPAAISVRYFDRDADLPAYLSTGVATVLGVAIPAALVVLLLSDQIAGITQVPGVWLWLVVPLVVARVVGTTLLVLLRVQGKAFLYAVLQNTQSAGLIALTLILVLAVGLDWRGRITAEVVTWLAFAILGGYVVARRNWLRRSLVATYATDLARFGLPLIPHTLGAVAMMQIDRLLVTNLVGVEETGLYTVGYQLALVIELVAVSFNYAYAPWLFRQLAADRENTKQRLVRYTYLQFAVMAAFAAIVAIAMPWLAGILLDPSFFGSGQYVGWFATGFLFSAMYYMVTNYIFYARRTVWLSVVTITVALFNIPLTYALITINGSIGAAQAMAISMGLSFLGTWVVSQRVFPMPWLGRLAGG